eukprot:765518-Hanusia_phi.AAC.21
MPLSGPAPAPAPDPAVAVSLLLQLILLLLPSCPPHPWKPLVDCLTVPQGLSWVDVLSQWDKGFERTQHNESCVTRSGVRGKLVLGVGFASWNNAGRRSWRYPAVLAAKKDSVVRAMAYTLVLAVLATYLIWWQLVPEIRSPSKLIPSFDANPSSRRKWHNLVPADCMIAGKAQLLSFHNQHGHEVKIAHVRSDV